VEPEPELDLLLRRPADPISSRGSVVLKVGLRHGKSTSRATHLVQLPGNNVQLLLDLLVEQLPGSSDLEDMIVINVAAAKVAALRRGSSPGLMTEDRIITIMVATVVVVVVTGVQEEVMDKVRLLEAQLPGVNRNHTQVTAHPAWTTMVRHRLRRQVEVSHRRRRRTLFRLPHHHHNEW
jgi:hypothetical protein